jgi:hypothetical protein
MAPNLKLCSRCGRKHSAPTGKKCKFPIPDADELIEDENSFRLLSDLDDQSEGAVGGPPPPEQMAPVVTQAPADAFAQILTVVSHLAERLEVTQRQVSELQSTRSQGAIPKVRCVPASRDQASPPDARLPSLDSLRSDPVMAAQAAALVDDLNVKTTGNHTNTGATKRGWARPGGDNAPKVCTPWPQDFVVGHGRRNRLLYDDMDVFQFVQGCISIIEQTSDISTMRLMLAQLRSTMLDASFHGFDSARYSYGIILSMLEDGALSWADQFRMSEEWRSALIARGSVSRAGPPGTDGRRAGASSGPPTTSRPTGSRRGPQNSQNSGPRPCIYYNNGVCANRTDHSNNGTLWKHVCRRCWSADHLDKDCPLGPGGAPQ